VKKRISGEAYDVNKQTAYSAKTKIESRAHYAPEPTQGVTHLKCGEMVNCDFVANLLLSVTVKEFKTIGSHLMKIHLNTCLTALFFQDYPGQLVPER